MSQLAKLPCFLPIAGVPSSTNPKDVAESIKNIFDNLVDNDFSKNAVWRDICALSGSFRTFYGAQNISTAWNDMSTIAKVHSFSLQRSSARKINIGQGSWIETAFTFETASEPPLLCTAILSMVPTTNGKWKIWVMRTVLDQLKLQPSVDTIDTCSLVPAISLPAKGHAQSQHFDCIVVGGGQAGLSVAGRLKALGVSYVVLEKNAEVGDNWKLRYDSTRLHTTREYAHLPFERTFSPEYQEFLTKDDLSRGYRSWATKYDINIWLGTTLKSGVWRREQNKWSMTLGQHDAEIKISASFVVMAVGAGCQIKYMPVYPGLQNFGGIIQHSAEYTSASEWSGKSGIVIGTANTAHDVAEDMLKAGLRSVTMVQRSVTYVLPAEHYKKILDVLYNESTPTELADKLSSTNPLGISRIISQQILHAYAGSEPERYDSLERAGFKTERYGDIMFQLCERFGGHYMDVGTSAKISAGAIKVKSNSLPVRYTNDGLAFSDGSELKADVVVFATGFEGNMRRVIRQLFGDEVANDVEDFWGVDDEGEIKGAWKPSGHKALWCHGGTVGQARYFSRFIALQIKAALLGSPLKIYRGGKRSATVRH